MQAIIRPIAQPRHILERTLPGQCIHQPRKGQLALAGYYIFNLCIPRQYISRAVADLRPAQHDHAMRQRRAQLRQQRFHIRYVPYIAANAQHLRVGLRHPLQHPRRRLVDGAFHHLRPVRGLCIGLQPGL